MQDLRPNSQDTSAFYLGNIYQVLVDPNVTRISIPPPVAKPPPFSPPKYAVWVNSLWFLSLVMSVSCALLATSLHQWARRYIRLTQPARCSPEKRARMHAFFANGVDKMHIPWAVEGLPTLLHLSLFLFFGGLVIFLFNVDREVFTSVVPWIGLFSIVYGTITLLPLIRQDSPYYAPLSMPAWFLYTSIPYLTFEVLAFITGSRYGGFQTWERCHNLREHYRGWMLGGVEKVAEETVSEQSSKIDVRILGWTINALGNDDSLEKFFEAIPGLFNSKLVKNLERDFPEKLLTVFWGALDGFMGRTLSSNLASESVKSRRVIICRDIMSMIPCSNIYMHDYLRSHFYQAPVSIDRLQVMARWFTHMSLNVSYSARIRAAENLAKMQERDCRWIQLASDVYGLSERDLQHNVTLGGDNVLLATLIHVSRRTIHFHELWLVRTLTEFDIRRTLPGLQHDFCTLWNEFAQEARSQPSQGSSTPIQILCEIRHLYIALHQGTGAAPTAFSASTNRFDRVLRYPMSYPFCDIVSHLPNSTVFVPVPNSRAVTTAFRQVKEARITPGHPSLSDPMTPGEIEDNFQTPAATSPSLPVHTSPLPTDAVVAALQDIPPATRLFRPLDTVAPGAEAAESEINATLSTASTPAPTPTLASVPESIPSVLNTSLISCDARSAPASNPLPPALPVVGFSSPSPPPPPRLPPLPNVEFLTLLRSTTPPSPTGNITLPRLRTRGLVNSGNMCFVNAVLQLLVHSPPVWDMFRRLGDLKGAKGQRGVVGPETGGCATPLVDAMVRFFEEFVFEEKEAPTTQQPLQHSAKGKPSEDEEEKKDNRVVSSFEPTYLYDAMKEKRQLKTLLVRSRSQDAPFYY